MTGFLTSDFRESPPCDREALPSRALAERTSRCKAEQRRVSSPIASRHSFLRNLRGEVLERIWKMLSLFRRHAGCIESAIEGAEMSCLWFVKRIRPFVTNRLFSLTWLSPFTSRLPHAALEQPWPRFSARPRPNDVARSFLAGWRKLARTRNQR